MKLARARSRRAPEPSWRTKRAPEILAARSKSRMPRASPISQWGLAGKSKVGMVPQVFWTTLSCSEVPAGTESLGRLGRDSRSSRRRRSASAARASSCSVLSLSEVVCAATRVTSPPSRLMRPNSAERALRWALRDSASVMAEAAAVSRSENPGGGPGLRHAGGVFLRPAGDSPAQTLNRAYRSILACVSGRLSGCGAAWGGSPQGWSVKFEEYE